MDQTASSPILHQLGIASSIKPTESAGGILSQSSGVVLPATTQAYYEASEDAAQMEAMRKRNGPPDYIMYHDRKMQQIGNPYTTPLGMSGAPITQSPQWTTTQQAGGFAQPTITGFKLDENLNGDKTIDYSKAFFLAGGISCLIVAAGVLWKCFWEPPQSGKPWSGKPGRGKPGSVKPGSDKPRSGPGSIKPPGTCGAGQPWTGKHACDYDSDEFPDLFPDNPKYETSSSSNPYKCCY